MRGIPAIPLIALVLLVVLGLTPSPVVADEAPRGWTVERVRFEPLDDASVGLLGGHDYRGILEVAAPPDRATVVAINHLGLEDYMRGISEVPVSWPLEAQKAQAIAARTYALHQIGRDVATTWRRAGADICATQACQVYAGLAKERRAGAGRWTAAVDATARQILVHDGAPILAKYSSSNGGKTVSGGRVYLASTDDPDDAHSPLHQWQSKVGLGEVAALYELGDRLRWVRSAGTIIELTEELPGGELRQHHIAAPEFRDRLNGAFGPLDGLPYRVPSNRYAAWTDTASGTVVVEGRGYGHGIGMSQYGAFGKALRGMPAGEILASYYGGLKPVEVPSDRLPDAIGVAVADQAKVDVVSAGLFRVIDQDGRVLAHVADGEWSVRRASSGASGEPAVEVVPPPDQHAAPTIGPVEVDAPVMGSDDPAVVRFRLSAPALVDVTLDQPTGPDLVFEQRRAAAGDLTYRLPAERKGQYVMTVVARGGDARETRLPIRFDVGDVPVRGVPNLASWSGPDPSNRIRFMVGLAGTAWLIVLAALGALRPRLH
jgi:stage II sporulation protein D